MTVGNVFVNDTVRIKVKFVDIDSVTGDQVDVYPISVSVRIFKADETEIVSTTASSLSASEFYHDYTPSEAGQYKISFVGTLANNSFITVNQQLYVSTSSEDYRPTITLRADEIISFAPDLNPLYLDPEELLAIFPDASLLEIGELIHHYSVEIKEMYAIKDDNTSSVLTFTILEYIRASVACELSRTYGFGGDDELSVQLGDLQINNKNVPRSTVTRANATTWCQIAAALRKEIMLKRVGLKGVQPKGLPSSRAYKGGGSLDPQTGALIYINDNAVYGSRDMYRPGETGGEGFDPMPDRNIKRYD
jgi:hypothetical protein